MSAPNEAPDAQTNERSRITEGLRRFADFLDATPDLPIPSIDTVGDLTWQVGSTVEDPAAEIARIARLLPCKLDKNDPADGDYNATYYRLTGALFGLTLEVWGFRERVCTKVVIGIRQVTKQVPDPDAPLVEVTEDVEIFEWQCGPLLAEVPR